MARTQTDPVRIGLVGLGWFGRLHRQVWDSCPGAEVVAICDVDAAAARGEGESAQDAFHTTAGTGGAARSVQDIPAFSDITQMLQACEIDLVDIATPEALHAGHAQTALTAGKPVIIEKPFTTSGADARELARMAQAADLPVCVGNILRFDPRYMHVMAQFKALGQKPQHLSLQRHFQRSALAVYGRVDPFYGACIHDIDLAIWSQGARPTRALGHISRHQQSGEVIAATGMLEWASGHTAVIQNAWIMPAATPAGFAFESTFLARDQALTVRSQPVVEQIGAARSDWPEFFFWPEIGGDIDGALRRELTHYLDCARDRKPSDRLPLDEAVWGIETADALVRSAMTGHWQDVGV
ncbi:Gfo/Idh/MocA family oxidoreductase [Maricaulis sp.]|uniref:Gfo/Idh/MocA family protein n=1 Tax=Maricaulis sp. TaxID=1486257 RepID=UPI002606F749|nr:Gfo/Idh/MocA family oxidoreductase [Maricaulis sp.]